MARLWHLLPTLTATPFTLGYGLVLLGTGLFAHLGDPRTVHDLLAGSSTDVSNLSERPLLTLLASGLWIVGGITSPYLLAFLLVLSALERRIGGLRTAGVFLAGHVLATLLTELPVAASVAVGELPDSSLRRLDYGVSYGLIACAGALAGLVRPRLRWALIGGVGLLIVAGSLVDFDPLTDWGHVLALLTGVACRPYVRRVARDRAAQRRGVDGWRRSRSRWRPAPAAARGTPSAARGRGRLSAKPESTGQQPVHGLDMKTRMPSELG